VYLINQTPTQDESNPHRYYEKVCLINQTPTQDESNPYNKQREENGKTQSGQSA